MHIILMGEMATGKDYLLDYIVKTYGFRRIVTYTTRPKRVGEVDGISYHFLTEREFLEKEKNGFFLEVQVYRTKNGDWFYGTSKDSCLEDNSIIILDKNGWLEYSKITDNLSIFLYNNSDIEKFYRACKRIGTNVSQKEIDEIHRRLNIDKNKFADVLENVDLALEQTYDNKVIDKLDKFLKLKGVVKI